MSATTMNGGDSVKPAANNAPAGNKSQLKSNTTGKALDGARKQAGSPVDGQTKKSQPKAWTGGSNPITQRPVNSTNGTQKPQSPVSSPSQHSKHAVETNADKHAHDRALFLFSQFVGKDVTVTLKSGEQYTGVYSAESDPAQQYVLKMTRQIKPPTNQQVNGNTDLPFEYVGEQESDHIKRIAVQDTVDLEAQDLTVASSKPSHQNGSIAGSFMTDTQISSRESHLPRERELKRWEPGPDSSIDMSLESSGDTTWDQFATNERMYGVQSTYDENIYTTSIDRSNPEYRRRELEAERIAREIEGSAPANSHVAEERRRDAHRDDVDGDEEEKYSGVRREESALPKRTAGAYIPPSQRPITSTPSVPGAPFDPAIISSQIKATPQPPSETSKNTSAPAPAATPETASRAAPAATSESAKKKENTTEEKVRDTADAFKQFANNEKLRIRQAQEAKRVNMKQEKNVKLNDLKKFAANFKLKSRVPDDLVPILAKDREKQLEIQQKAEQAAKDEETKAKDRDTDKASSTVSPAPSSSMSQSGATPAVDQRGPPRFDSRARVQQGRGPMPSGQGQSPRAPLPARFPNNQFYGRHNYPQPLPTDLRIPPGQPAPAADLPMSPTSATRLNVNAKSFEFRPGASAFTPTGTSPSPQRLASVAAGSPAKKPTASFFSKKKEKDTKQLPDVFDPLKRLAEADYTDQEKQKYVRNGGIPQAFNTVPTWPFGTGNENIKHTDTFPKAPVPSQGPSPMQTPIPNQMPHSHQLPPHMQGPPMPLPNQRQPFYAQPQHGHGPSFDPRLQQQFGPNGSVQNSPRTQQIPPFNGQMPPMQQFPGQPMPGYGMSPSMQYRQPLPQGTPLMMHAQPQPGQMMPMRPGFPGHPQFHGPQMGGHMMVQNPSQGYVNGPMPQGYSPMPHHAQPQMPHMQHGGPGNFQGSPRPHMMTHQGSHQGYNPQMQPQFAPSPGQQPHPYHMNQRAMSSGFHQMTPRQQAALPNHPSPGMGAGQGDEGK